MKERVTMGDKVFEGEAVTIVSEQSFFSEALLSDGTVIRIRPIVTKVLFIPELSAFMGKPIYHIEVGLIKDYSVPITEPTGETLQEGS